MSNKLIVTPSPHVKDSVTTQSIMGNVVLALAPAMVASVLIFGVRALLILITCVVSCVAAEYLFEMVCKKPNTTKDLSAVVTGVILAMNLPSSLPLWMAAVGSIVAIVVVKQLFGGIGQNFANPAITARVVLLISFTQPMTKWVSPNFGTAAFDAMGGATPLAVMKNAGETLPSLTEMLLGFHGGSLGETCSIALLIGGLYLIAKKIISPIIPASFIATVFVLTAVLGQNPIYHILGGGLFLGAFFMATDYVTSPVTDKGKLIFGIGCGVIPVLIRLFANYPEGVSFAILLMNIITPHIDNLTRNKAFGGAY